jgi:hypothetical protein
LRIDIISNINNEYYFNSQSEIKSIQQAFEISKENCLLFDPLIHYPLSEEKIGKGVAEDVISLPLV